MVCILNVENASISIIEKDIIMNLNIVSTALLSIEPLGAVTLSANVPMPKSIGAVQRYGSDIESMKKLVG